MGSLELLRRLLAASARLSSRRPCTVLAGALLVTLAAAWPAVRTLRNIESNLVEVLTAGLPRAETYKRIARDFGVIDRHYLVVEAADPADLPAAKELASRLAAALSSDPGRDGRLRSALDGDTALAARLGAALDGDCGLAGRLGLALGRSDGLADRLALALPGDPGLARDLAAVLGPDRRRAARLARALPMVRSARARLDLGRFLRDHAQLYLDAESAAALAARFSDEGLARAMERNARLLEAGTPWQRVEADPLDLASLLPELARRRGAGEGSGLDPDGFMVSADRRMVLVSVLATQSAGDRGFTARLMEHSRETVRRESGEFFSGERAGLAGRLSVEIGGAYAAMEQHGSLLLRGLLLSSAGALAVILLMFAVAYRRASSLLFVGLPLLAPVVWTLAAAPLLLGGRLSILGAGFAAVLLGLGIDFAVHLYNRYVSARAGGLAPAEAAEASVNSTGEGIVIGALTTVAAFAGMALTSFRGLTEFGVMAALGVGLSMVGLLAVLPAALVVISRRSEQIRPAPAPSPFGLGLVARMVESRPGALLALGGLVMAAGLAAACVAPGRHGLGFESDFAALGPPREVDTSGELNRRVARAFGQAEREVSVVVRGADAGEVMARTAGLRERARALAASGAVGPMRSILDIVPSPAEQERSLTLARALPLGDLPARLDRAAVAAGFRAGSFARFGGEVGRLAEGIRAGERLDPGRIPDPALAEMAGFFFAPAAPDRPVWQTNSRIALPAGRSDPDVYAANLASAKRTMIVATVFYFIGAIIWESRRESTRGKEAG